MDKLSTESYKGVRDFYPQDQAVQNYLFSTMRRFVERVGYVEYHASVLEEASLYRGKTSEEIVNEQTYTFTDRGGREVTLRPEMTPTVARMVAARRRELGFPLRLYSIPNVFRYERPQRGRLREHWQLNVDLFGTHSLYADAEIIGVAYGIMKAFGAKDEDFIIKVNDRGALEALAKEYSLSSEQSTKLLGLLDRKNKISTKEFTEGLQALGIAPEKVASAEIPSQLQRMIDEFSAAGITNIAYEPSVVRGFDYYTGMVFEVFDTHPENSRSLFGGGRYDNLTKLFDDEPLPGVGFGMGDVTMVNFLQIRNLLPPYRPPTQVYIAVSSSELSLEAQKLAGELRRAGVNVAIDFGDKKLGDQIKVADKHKIPYVIVLGPDELSSGEFTIRDLQTGKEEKFPRMDLSSFFHKE